MNKEVLPEILKNVKEAPNYHLVADCPFCTKEQHFYINSLTFLWDCKRCSESGNLYKLLKQVERLDLLGGGRILLNYIEPLLKDTQIDAKAIETLDLSTKNKLLPIGFKRVYSNDYLKSRYFTNYDFHRYIIGFTKYLAILKDYIVFSITQNNVCKGYVARNLRNDGRKRYLNSKGADFAKLFFGCDEVTPNTTRVILVEGIFDKIRLDNYLGLIFSEDVKCLACFGKKLTKFQIEILRDWNLKEIIFCFDKDALNDVKNVMSGIKGINLYAVLLDTKDPSSASDVDLYRLFENILTFSNFYYKTVPYL